MGTTANTASILFVDDEIKIQNIVRTMLTMNGFTVTCASNVDEACEILRDAPVDILITDHLMPGKTGLDLIREIHESRPGLIKILMTGIGNAAVVSDAITSGELTGVVDKPFRGETLIETIRHALREHSGKTG